MPPALARMKILFLSTWYPYPPVNGSKLRVYNLLRGLAEQHELTLLTFSDQAVTEHPAPLRRLCRSVHAVPWQVYRPNSARAMLGVFSPLPRWLVDTRAPLMQQEIDRELATEAYDLIIASQWGTAIYVHRRAGVPAIFEELELGALEAKRLHAATPLHRWRHSLPLLKMRLALAWLLPRFAACTVVSEQERVIVQRLAPGYRAVEVIPNCVDLAGYPHSDVEPTPNTLIFTGSFRYQANYNAMVWFVREVYPLLRSSVPDVQLTITGDHADLPLPSKEQIRLTGHVEDVRPLVAASSVSLAPILLGGGTRLKILEAMALRTPVVATSKGAEGLNVREGEHLLIADSPTAYATAVIRLLREPGLRRRIVDNACRLVSEQYAWPVVTPRLLDLVEQIALSR